jgi:non-heme chloroperoxidase
MPTTWRRWSRAGFEKRDPCRPLDRRRRSRSLPRTPWHEARRQSRADRGSTADYAQTTANPGGLPIDVFDDIRKNVLADRAQFFRDLSAPFYGANRPGAKVSQGLRDSFWTQGMQCGLNAAFDYIKAFSETDFTEDLKKIDVPSLIIHGDDDQIVPIGASATLSSKMIKNARLEIYQGAPHGLCSTLKDKITADLLAFFKS